MKKLNRISLLATISAVTMTVGNQKTIASDDLENYDFALVVKYMPKDYVFQHDELGLSLESLEKDFHKSSSQAEKKTTKRKTDDADYMPALSDITNSQKRYKTRSNKNDS